MTDRLGFSASILSMIGILSITVVEVGAGTIITKPIASDIWYINAPKGSGSSRVYNVIEYSGSQPSGMYVISLFCDYTTSILGRSLHITAGAPPYYSESYADLRARVTQPCNCRIRISEYDEANRTNYDGINPVWSPYFRVQYFGTGLLQGQTESLDRYVSQVGEMKAYSLSGVQVSTTSNRRPNLSGVSIITMPLIGSGEKAMKILIAR